MVHLAVLSKCKCVKELVTVCVYNEDRIVGGGITFDAFPAEDVLHSAVARQLVVEANLKVLFKSDAQVRTVGDLLHRGRLVCSAEEAVTTGHRLRRVERVHLDQAVEVGVAVFSIDFVIFLTCIAICEKSKSKIISNKYK